MNFDNDEDIMKAIMGGGTGGGNVDDELAALEAEIGGGKKGEDDELAALENELDEEDKPKAQKKSKPKNDSDDELAALEKEGLDDVEDEKPAKKKQEVKKPPPKVEKKEQPKPKPEPVKEVPKGPDLYPEIIEKKYHNVEKMTCLGALEKEKGICDKIIEYKKKIGKDYDDWEMKKDSIDDKIGTINSFVEDGLWDLNRYKQELIKQFKLESKLLLFADKDPTLNDEQRKTLKDRLTERKNLIDFELKANPEEEAAKEEPKKEEPKKEQPKKEEPKKQTPSNGPDLYPEIIEKKYHSVEKMTCLGALENEKLMCDNIIDYKKKIGKDYDDWEIKKDSIDDKIGTINSFVEDGLWDLNRYKQELVKQFKLESKLLLFADKDPTLNDEQRKTLKDRLTERKNLIDKELKQNPEEEEGEEKPKEEKKKEEPKKEAPKKEIIETKKSLNPVFSVPKDKESEEIKRLNDIVVDRLNEYRAAIDYFKNQEFGEQRVDATNKAKLICIELKKIQDGKWKEVNEFKLPDPITPGYIYGYSKEERLEKFKKIILDYDKQRKEFQQLLNAKIEVLKKLPPAKMKKMKDAAVKDLNEMKAKKEKFDKVINLLKEKMQDVWVPAPLFIEQEKEIKTEKMNKDIPECVVRIIFGKTTYVKDKSLYLIVTHEGKHETKFEQKKPGNWEQTIDWKYDKGEFKVFHRNKITVQIWEKRMIFKDTLKGRFEMEPKELKSQIEVTKDYPITLESGRDKQTATVTFKVRTPCKDPEYIVETKTFLQVTKIYPAFNLKGGNNNQSAIKLEAQTASVTAQDLSVNNSVNTSSTSNTKKPTAAKPTAQPQKPKPAQGGKPGAGGKKPAHPSAPVDKSQFKEEELNDPDCIDCLNTLSVLQFKHNKYEEIRSKIDGRTPRDLMQRIIKIKCKIQNIENAMGDEITPQDYLALLKVTFDHDKKLAEYFKQIGNKEKFTLVNERLPLIVKETEELLKQMPK